VGGGHNGLVCGAYLAKAGLSVCVLERRSLIGGAAVTEEVWPGYKVSTASYVMALMQPKIILDLELQKFGFEVLKSPPLFQPFPDDSYLVFWDEMERTCAEIAKFSAKDAAAYPEYRKKLQTLAPMVRQLIYETPVDITSTSPRDLIKTLRFIWRNRALGKVFYELYDILTLSAFEYLDRWFESDRIKAALSYYAGGGGGNQGPKSQTSAYVLLRPLLRDHGTAAGGWGFMRGGMGAIPQAIAASGKRFGLEVRTDAEVAEIKVVEGRAVGVVLATGEEIRAKSVIANASAKTTFQRLVPQENLTDDFRHQIANFRVKSSVFKVNLAMDRLPQYRAFDPKKLGFDYPAQVRLAPSVDYLEQAFDDSKYGRIPKQPLLTLMTPTIVDDTIAPAGKHIVTMLGAHAPYSPGQDSWDNGGRDLLLKNVLDTVSAYAPGAADGVLHSQVLVPPDLERIFDLPGGHVHHGDLTVDQIFFRRPVPGYADYRSPIGGLYQCGSSVHPGGGVTGVPGHNAAREILRDFRRRMPAN
jgi:phytoene dehydrogenase-like protein